MPVHDKELKSKWVAALRSGEFVQGKYCLKTEESPRHCCLGVLCEVMKVTWEKEPVSVGALRVAGPTTARIGWLPFEVRNSVGLTADEEMSLANMNDFGHPFQDIADRIEEKL